MPFQKRQYCQRFTMFTKILVSSSFFSHILKLKCKFSPHFSCSVQGSYIDYNILQSITVKNSHISIVTIQGNIFLHASSFHPYLTCRLKASMNDITALKLCLFLEITSYPFKQQAYWISTACHLIDKRYQLPVMRSYWKSFGVYHLSDQNIIWPVMS